MNILTSTSLAIGAVEKAEIIHELTVTTTSLAGIYACASPDDVPEIVGMTGSTVLKSIVHSWRNFRNLSDVAFSKYGSRYANADYPEIQNSAIYREFYALFEKFVVADKLTGPHILICRIEDGGFLIIRRLTDRTDPAWPFALYSSAMATLTKEEKAEFAMIRSATIIDHGNNNTQLTINDLSADTYLRAGGLYLVKCTFHY
jgi:hypothetical protein